MLIRLTNPDSSSFALNSDLIWKVVETDTGCIVYVGTGSYTLSTSYADVLALGAGAFIEYDTIVAGQTVTIALNQNVIQRVSRDGSKVYLHLIKGDKIRVDATFAETVPDSGVVVKTADFVADGPSGTTYVSGEAELEGITATFVDSPIGTEYTFFARDLPIQLDLTDLGVEEDNHTIQFWQSGAEEDRNTVLVGLYHLGKSITIKKISATRWAGIAVSGAVDAD